MQTIKYCLHHATLSFNGVFIVKLLRFNTLSSLYHMKRSSWGNIHIQTRSYCPYDIAISIDYLLLRCIHSWNSIITLNQIEKNQSSVRSRSFFPSDLLLVKVWQLSFYCKISLKFCQRWKHTISAETIRISATTISVARIKLWITRITKQFFAF